MKTIHSKCNFVDFASVQSALYRFLLRIRTPMEVTKDEYDPEEILAQARLAAEEVAEKLAQKKPSMEVRKSF